MMITLKRLFVISLVSVSGSTFSAVGLAGSESNSTNAIQTSKVQSSKAKPSKAKPSKAKPENWFEASLSNINPVKIKTSDENLARKIAISFHHAILESHIDEGYLIADLSQSDIQKLKDHPVELIVATDWLSKAHELAEKVYSRQANEKTSLTSSAFDGIPGYECYRTVEETYQEGERLANEYPQLASWIDIGDSWQKQNGSGGYDLMVLRITNQAISGDKPILFIHSAMHAREYTPAALTLDFAKELVESYESNADYRWIVDHHEVHILFHMNPDGRKIAEEQIFQRKNTNQNHCPSGHVGIDLNRNFAHTWGTVPGGSSGDSCDATFRGDSAESEPETQAVSNYMRSIFADRRGPADSDAAPDDTKGMHLDIHSYSELVLWPWGHTDDVSPNDASFVEIGHKLAWFNNYAPMQSVGLYPTDGTSDDVSYGELGVPALTFELGTEFFESCNNYNLSIKPDNLKALTYAAKIVGAPYLIPFGPDISDMTLNGIQGSITVTAGTPVNLNLLVSSELTRSSATENKNIARISYSIDVPIWDVSANPEVIFENTSGTLNAQESIAVQIPTGGLANGQHLLFVQAENSDGQVGAISAAFIEIGDNNAPLVAFSGDCTDLSCDFDASDSTDSDGQISLYHWDFGDGNTADGMTASHSFAVEGNKTVTLTVTDNQGSAVSLSQEFNVTAVVPVPLPVPDESSSGGSGSLGYLWMVLFGLVGCGAVKQRRRR